MLHYAIKLTALVIAGLAEVELVDVTEESVGFWTCLVPFDNFIDCMLAFVVDSRVSWASFALASEEFDEDVDETDSEEDGWVVADEVRLDFGSPTVDELLGIVELEIGMNGDGSVL